MENRARRDEFRAHCGVQCCLGRLRTDCFAAALIPAMFLEQLHADLIRIKMGCRRTEALRQKLP